MTNPYEYRNKAQFQVRLIDGHVAAGLYKENSHDLVDLPTCSVQMPATMTVMRQVVAWLEELKYRFTMKNIILASSRQSLCVKRPPLVKFSWSSSQIHPSYRKSINY